jgi:hypothetical protein
MQEVTIQLCACRFPMSIVFVHQDFRQTPQNVNNPHYVLVLYVQSNRRDERHV